MNKRDKKAYEKAMDYYENGKINKALELCEQVLSKGLDNPVVLNFKGLLLYQKGNLNEAVTVWKINKEINNDRIAENYIKASIVDEKRLTLYKQAEKSLRQLKIDEALELFKECATSDFNSIKVNTGLALCYQKKGDLYRAKEYVNKALNIDKDAITAKTIEKGLKEDGVYLDSEKHSNKFLITLTIIFIILAMGAGGYVVISKFKNTNLQNNVEEAKNNQVESETKADNENKELNAEEKNKEQVQNVSIDKEKLKTLINNNDFNGIYEQLKNVNGDSLSGEDSELYKKAVSLIKDQGVPKFYQSGLEYFNQGNYSSARSELDKAYTYCEGNSLKEHILFYRASNSSKLSDVNVAVGQFEEYYNQYSNGVYTQEALYELTLLSNQVDKQKSKNYANILIKNFPKSIYANDNIVKIANS